MTATTVPVTTPTRLIGLAMVLLAANTKALEGAFALVGADGYGSSTAGADQICVGVWDESADNTGGDDGDASARALYGRQFLVFNDETNPVTQAHFGQNVYVLDNQTVSASDNAGARCVAGKFRGFDNEQPTMLWVEI